MPPTSTTQLVIFLLVVAAGVIRLIVTKLHEQAQRKRREEAREQRVEESLRTGRDPGDAEAAPVSDAERLRRLAAQRQAHLQELRKRAMARQVSGAAPPAPPPTAPTPPARTQPASRQPMRATTTRDRMVMVPGPVFAPQAPAPPRPKFQRGAPQRQPGPASTPKPAPHSAPKHRPRAPALVESLPPAAEAVSLPASPASPARPAPKALVGHHLSVTDWQKALVLREILSPPVSLRAHDDL